MLILLLCHINNVIGYYIFNDTMQTALKNFFFGKFAPSIARSMLANKISFAWVVVAAVLQLGYESLCQFIFRSLKKCSIFFSDVKKTRISQDCQLRKGMTNKTKFRFTCRLILTFISFYNSLFFFFVLICFYFHFSLNLEER